MSGWNWLHTGLQVATLAKAYSAESQLSEMKAVAEVEAARQALLEAIRNFIFDISRNVQIVEEQIKNSPQQVYIVLKALEVKLAESGVSPEIFPDLQDKEYCFKTQQKLTKLASQAKETLTQSQITEAETALQYISEIQMLRPAILAKEAEEGLNATKETWIKLKKPQERKNLFKWLGILGLVISFFMAIPLSCTSLGIFSGDIGMILLGLISLAILLGFFSGSVGLLVLQGKTNPVFSELNEKRKKWTEKLLAKDDWGKIVETFGDLSSQDFQRLYDEKLAYITPLVGHDFQKLLTTTSE
jgi:hypothetical protein